MNTNYLDVYLQGPSQRLPRQQSFSLARQEVATADEHAIVQTDHRADLSKCRGKPRKPWINKTTIRSELNLGNQRGEF